MGLQALAAHFKLLAQCNVDEQVGLTRLPWSGTPMVVCRTTTSVPSGRGFIGQDEQGLIDGQLAAQFQQAVLQVGRHIAREREPPVRPRRHAQPLGLGLQVELQALGQGAVTAVPLGRRAAAQAATGFGPARALQLKLGDVDFSPEGGQQAALAEFQPSTTERADRLVADSSPCQSG